MNKYITTSVIIALTFAIFSPVSVDAKSKGSSYYKSSKSGRFVSPSYAGSHKSTTYKSYRK